ncbi:hypothetical protein C8F04DRAFT_146158 [Mycena alexandri]|uniref:Uncharacterized protein n=1 Tax=Mycena alexandri TaxID=1745969 RepID=A0AAD6TAR5_9AGAR|nr:hypothetical protein C8F04DRAFT_146158 [Mycena alexandri]
MGPAVIAERHTRNASIFFIVPKIFPGRAEENIRGLGNGRGTGWCIFLTLLCISIAPDVLAELLTIRPPGRRPCGIDSKGATPPLGLRSADVARVEHPLCVPLMRSRSRAFLQTMGSLWRCVTGAFANGSGQSITTASSWRKGYARPPVGPKRMLDSAAPRWVWASSRTY